MEPIYVMTKAVIIPSLRAWFRWHVEGVENIPEKGPAIVAANHIAYLDPLAVAYGVVQAGRRPRFLTKSELMHDRRIAWILRGCGQIEVQRGTRNAIQALEEAYAALERGEVVCIFPEGTVTTDPDLRPLPSKTGAPRLALRSGAPVIPCGVWGTANVWPKSFKRNWKPKQDLAIRFGPPVVYEGDPHSAEDWAPAGDDVTNRIAELVASLKPLIPDRRRPRTGKSAAPS
ncbi:MAG: lysophospholipid acyltransferase family protein [Actinomycetota bacterium]